MYAIVDVCMQVDVCKQMYAKVDIYLVNDLCFEKVCEMIPIPVRDIELYMNREKLLENFDWMNELHSKFTEVYSASM